MSFLFKSKNQKAGAHALPPASRDIKSSDGTNNSGSQIPTLNGVVKPGSPTPGQSVNTSLNSLSENARPGTGNGGSRIAQAVVTPEEKVAYTTAEQVGRSSGMDSPEQKTMKQEQAVRNGSSDIVCLSLHHSGLETIAH